MVGRRCCRPNPPPGTGHIYGHCGERPGTDFNQCPVSGYLDPRWLLTSDELGPLSVSTSSLTEQLPNTGTGSFREVRVDVAAATGRRPDPRQPRTAKGHLWADGRRSELSAVDDHKQHKQCEDVFYLSTMNTDTRHALDQAGLGRHFMSRYAN